MKIQKSMKHFLVLLFLLGAMQLFGQKKKAVFIIVDGIPADLIEKLPTPNLDAIAGENGYKRSLVGGEKNGYSQTPTISAVGYNSVLTGTWVNKHNVWGNYGKDIANPDYHYKSIFRVLKDAYPEKTIGIFSSWLDNRTRLAGEGLEATGNLQFNFKYDGLELDTVKYPNDTTSLRMRDIDESVVEKASVVIKEQAPDLSWVYLEFTDDMGHTFGDSPQFDESIQQMDKQMGKIWQSVQYREKHFGEDWLIIITTDHGRDSTGKNHGGQSERERSGWIVTNAKTLNAHYMQDTIAMVDIMPTIADHFNIKIPTDLAWEVDGTSIIGKVGAGSLNAACSNDVITVTWKSRLPKGKAKLYVTTTNHFKSGGRDEYQLVGVVPIEKEHATFPAPVSKDGFYKIVLETRYNTLNRWIVGCK